LEDPPRRSIPRIVAISAAQLAMQVAYSMEYSLSNPLMGKLGMPQWSYALVTASDPLTGLFVQPVFGSLSDHCRSKWGRRRPYILLGSGFVILFLIVLLFTEQIAHAISSTNWEIWARVILILSLVGYNAALNGMQNPSRTIIQDLVPASQRVEGNFVGSIGVAFGFFFVNLIGAIDFSKHLNYTNEQIVFVSGAILFFISVVATLIFAKEEQYLGPVLEESPIVDSFRALISCPPAVTRAGICLFLALFAFVPFQTVCTDFFGVDIYGGSAANRDPEYDKGVSFGMLVLTLMSGLLMVYCFLADRIIAIIGVKWAFTLAEIFDVIAFTSVFYTKNKWVLMGLMIPSGFSFGSSLAIPYAIVGLSVPKESIGVYLGVLNIAVELGGEIGLLVCQLGFGALSNKRWPTIGAAGVMAILAAVYPKFLIVPEIMQYNVNAEAEAAQDNMSIKPLIAHDRLEAAPPQPGDPNN
jgi:Na+/melibiose symporter-like transporter